MSPEIQNLIEYMRETVRDVPDVGLAAPQIGKSLRLAVIEDKVNHQKSPSEAELKERERREVAFHVIVNPVIELLAEPTETFFEGCLNLPGFTALDQERRRFACVVSTIEGNPGSSKLPDGTPASYNMRSIISMALFISIVCDTQFFFSGELHAALEGQTSNGIAAGSYDSYLDLRSPISYVPIHGASIYLRMSLLFSLLRGVGGIA